MGKEFFKNFREARNVFQEADDVVHLSISSLCFEGPEEALKLTENTQPAILTTSIAALRVLQAEKGLVPHLAAGHSLGEYSALVVSGALTFADAVQIVRLRGKFMQEAVPVGEGAMAAILGMERGQVEKLCESICLINKGKIVLSGTLSEVKSEYGQNGVTLRFKGDGSFLRDLPDVAGVNDYGNEVFLRLYPGADPARVLDEARSRLTLQKYEVAAPSIHDIFIEKVSGG